MYSKILKLCYMNSAKSCTDDLCTMYIIVKELFWYSLNLAFCFVINVYIVIALILHNWYHCSSVEYGHMNYRKMVFCWNFHDCTINWNPMLFWPWKHGLFLCSLWMILLYIFGLRLCIKRFYKLNEFKCTHTNV